MNASEQFAVKVDGLHIFGEIYYPHKNIMSPALCICHGIPAVVPTPGDQGYSLLAQRFVSEGFITCIFNFRGCGQSEGNLDLLDWTRDLDAVLTYLCSLKKVDNARVSVMGFSGGAAVSAMVAASDQRISCLVLCACPAQFSIGALGRDVEGFLDQCRRVGTIRDSDFPHSVDEWAKHFQQVRPIDHVDRISPRPLLIVHGDQDETIPPEHAVRLFDKAGEPRKLVVIAGGGHKLRQNEAAMDAALFWLEEINRLD